MPHTHEWSALGTYAQLVVDDGLDASPRRSMIAKRLVDSIDATCSRFRPDSDLSRASAAAGTWVEVDPLLVQAVDAALVAARSTDGLVDPTLGRALVALGYDRDLDLVRADSYAVVGGPTTSTGDERKNAVSGAGDGFGPLGGRWLEVETDPDGLDPGAGRLHARPRCDREGVRC